MLISKRNRLSSKSNTCMYCSSKIKLTLKVTGDVLLILFEPSYNNNNRSFVLFYQTPGNLVQLGKCQGGKD